MPRILDWWVELRLRHAVLLGMSVLLGLLVLCAVIVHFVEGWSWVDAFYFAMASLTTVGYGDLVAKHELTKIFLIFWLPIGIGVGLTVLAGIGTKLLEVERRHLERREQSRSSRTSED